MRGSGWVNLRCDLLSTDCLDRLPVCSLPSAYEDLKEKRQAAVEAILTAGHIPAGMELLTSGDESQMTVIKEWIDESDVYLLILGGRYGSVEPKTSRAIPNLSTSMLLRSKRDQ